MRRFKISILSLTKTVDADGFATKTWQTLCSPWADVVDVSGRTFYTGDGAKTGRVVTCTLSKDDRITSEMRVLHEGNVYKIIRPPYQKGSAGIEICIDCELIEAVSD
jgi:SPP1 family predicted phage head-tail adaptor